MTEIEKKRGELQRKLAEIKEGDAWLEGDKSAEKEVARIRKELKDLKDSEMTAMDRILKRCEPTAEEMAE